MEGLDAGSVPILIPSLRPSPLIMSWSFNLDLANVFNFLPGLILYVHSPYVS